MGQSIRYEPFQLCLYYKEEANCADNKKASVFTSFSSIRNTGELSSRNILLTSLQQNQWKGSQYLLFCTQNHDDLKLTFSCSNHNPVFISDGIKQRIADFCSTVGFSQEEDFEVRGQLVMDVDHKLGYCRHPKVNWMFFGSVRFKV